MKSSTTTLISALRILAGDIKSEDGVANAAIAEAADRMEELERENIKLRERIAFEASMNAQLKEKLENKTNSSN
jgi:hypothetical protein